MSSIFHASIDGIGLELQENHCGEMLTYLPPVPWLEVLAENYISFSPPRMRELEELRKHYPVVLRCMGMSLGSCDPLNEAYFIRLKKLIDWLEPNWVSDQLAFCSVDGSYLPEALPLPCHPFVVEHVAGRIKTIQSFLGQRILVKNPPGYLAYQDSILHPAHFLSLVAEKSDCWILLNLNNLLITCQNFNLEYEEFIENVSVSRVKQLHLTGLPASRNIRCHPNENNRAEPIGRLYQAALKKFGCVPTCITGEPHMPLSFMIAQASCAEEKMKHAIYEIA